MMRCPKCGMEEDRDVIAVRNLLLKYNNTQRDVPASSVPWGERLPMKSREEDPRLRKVNAGSERLVQSMSLFSPNSSCMKNSGML
ncbi:MAG: hypothetical protein KIH08_15260 [Candidatus Freyarchaeota archaeon]|nr:hypothetical protein [Candidatus Jordarchaeia archaeon]MBS7270563.1 hypothetical protein [Candidatus Jordarchaeia archaeon]